MNIILKRLLIAAVALSLCIVGGLEAYAALTDQSHIEETFYKIQSDKLKSNVRIVFLSDLHLSEFGERNSELLKRVRLLAPDLILIGGDMNLRQEDDYSVVIDLCLQLKEIADVYYALGNHEVARMLSHDRDIYYALEDTGVTMLHNVYQKVTVGDNTLLLGGVSQTGRDIDIYSNGIIEKLSDQEGFKLLLAHYPSDFDRICQYDIDLVLSGHLHGGQINLPYFDGLIDGDGNLFPKYTEGKFTRADTTMIVSRGLGNSHQIPRVNNAPEIVIVDIAPSVAAYNTNQLLNDYSLGSMPELKRSEIDSVLNDDSNMLAMMHRMETENQKYIDAALTSSGDTVADAGAWLGDGATE